MRQMNEDAKLLMPGDRHNHLLTHPACMGAKAKDVALFQTVEGESDTRQQYPHFGKP
jgi:hypothetical protein